METARGREAPRLPLVDLRVGGGGFPKRWESSLRDVPPNDPRDQGGSRRPRDGERKEGRDLPASPGRREEAAGRLRPRDALPPRTGLPGAGSPSSRADRRQPRVNFATG